MKLAVYFFLASAAIFATEGRLAPVKNGFAKGKIDPEHIAVSMLSDSPPRK